MTGRRKDTIKDIHRIKRIYLNTTIDEFLDLPEFRPGSKEWSNKSLRIITGLYYGKQHQGMATLKDLKDYVGDNGWLGSKAYKIALLAHMGQRTVAYFNQILKKYGLDSFEPLIKD